MMSCSSSSSDGRNENSLPLISSKRISDMTKMERWLAYFANQLSDDEMGELIMSDEAIHKAVDAARTFLQNDAV